MKLIPERSPLNLVPFIDIMLVLLCIVLSVSSFIAQGKIEVKLPASTSKAAAEDQVSLLLEVDASGQIFVDGKECPQDALQETLASVLKKEDHLQLRLDEKSEFAVFIGIIDVLKALQHENFSIATKRIS